LRRATDQALDRERAIRADFDRQRGETLTQNESAINYRIIQQEIETNKQLLDGLLQRSKENDVVLAGTPNNIYVADYAIVPDYPVGPQRMRSVVMALLLSLAGGVGLAVFLEYMNDSVRSTEDVERWLRLPSMGVIPAVGGFAKRRLLPALARAPQRHGKAPTRRAARQRRDALRRWPKPTGTCERPCCSRRPGTRRRRCSSRRASPAEGKTTTAVNTALSLAQTGASVLVVDADMRRPRLHTIFELDNATRLEHDPLRRHERGGDALDDPPARGDGAERADLGRRPAEPGRADRLGADATPHQDARRHVHAHHHRLAARRLLHRRRARLDAR
jgi:succinoglycan biosynthesis transport protein ExoP